MCGYVALLLKFIIKLHFTLIGYGRELLTQYCPGDKIEKNVIGWACSAYGVEERRILGFGGET